MPVVIPATHAYPHLVFPANTTNHAPPVLFPIERPTTTILVVAHGGVRTRRERETGDERGKSETSSGDDSGIAICNSDGHGGVRAVVR
ncbi:hypothetical protein HanPSC8_Chr01g0006741 [Helianthus annuus]|nr:hypothetical protein HanPSC8_Chr01g0006741 [Helianthus annuus]